MSARKDDFRAKFRALLREQPLPSPSLCRALGISQATLSRLWRDAGPDIIKLGAARSTTYAVKRDIAGVDHELPIYRVDRTGSASTYCSMRALQNNWYAIIPASTGQPEFMQGLPYFIEELRPQGFLGRLAPKQNIDLTLPERLSEWTDDDLLLFLSRRGENLPGNIIVGNESYLRWIGSPGAGGTRIIATSDREQSYPSYAQSANAGTLVGSSAGGEHPKFTAALRAPDGTVSHAIVKFSPSTDAPSGRRWADLLVCEHLAAVVLSQHGVPGCDTAIVEANGRYFLEAQRFDRNGQTGRMPIVSLSSLDSIFGMLDKPWSTVVVTLHDQGLLSTEDVERVRYADLFGALIGNTDRHPGNLSLSWSDRGGFALLPIYDMLPMMYRPNNQGEIIDREFSIDDMGAVDMRFIGLVVEIALDFWRAVQRDDRISLNFKEIAARHALAIARFKVRPAPAGIL